MTNHNSGPNTAEEIYSIVPVLAGFSADDITAGQDHAADTAEYNLPCQNTSACPFERRVGLADHVAIERTIANMMPWAAESINQKIFLPRQSGELPVQPATVLLRRLEKFGVMPSWAISAGAHPA